MKRRFYTLDVFTERRLAGNPLAVVVDADDLVRANDTAGMLAIAREFNLSETVFVAAPRDPVHSARIRNFTPVGELPFAGHPTVGTGVLLAHLNAADHMKGPGGVVIALEEEIGLVKVEVSQRQGRAARGVFAIPRLPERTPWTPDVELLGRALGINPVDIGFGAHAPSCWGVGLPFAMMPVRDMKTLAQAGIADSGAWREAFGFTGKSAAYVYTRETADAEHHIRARMFLPGIGEDPATGSAAAAFSGAAVHFERPEDGIHQIVIEQGYEMGRPSQIVLDLDVESGLLKGAQIGGGAVIVSEGTLQT